MRRFFLLLLSLYVPIAAQDFMPVDSLTSGMTGYCHTVFSGYQPEEFPLRIIDVLRNFQPKRNLILVQLEGEKAIHTGVASGMSGSPVYVNGKLAGALSYSIGAFMKDPLAGVTPIAEMTEIFSREDNRDRELAPSFAYENGFLEMALGLTTTGHWESLAQPWQQRPTAQLDNGLRPLALPLNFSGFQPSVVDLASRLISPAGFLAIAGGSGYAEKNLSSADMVPGSAIGAVLVAGDVGIEAIGTVTYRQDNRVLAFGHPFFNTGPVDLPISLAKVLTIAPSEFSAFKIGASSLLVGALKQDRSTGVYGVIGPVPRLIPLVVKYTDESGQDEDFHFGFTDEPTISTLMPLVLRFVLVNALQSARLATGENSLMLQGSIALRGGQEITLENFYPGVTQVSGFGMINGILQSTGEIAAAVGALMVNDFQPAQIDSIYLHFTSMAGRRSASLEQVWVAKNVVEKGDSVRVFVRLKHYHGREMVVSRVIHIPATAEGRFLNLTVGGGGDIARFERRLFPGKYSISRFEQLTALLNERRRNDELHFQLLAFDQGLFVDGEALAALPPTALDVLQARNATGNAIRANQRILWEASQRMAAVDQPSPRSQELLPVAIDGKKSIRLTLH